MGRAILDLSPEILFKPNQQADLNPTKKNLVDTQHDPKLKYFKPNSHRNLQLREMDLHFVTYGKVIYYHISIIILFLKINVQRVIYNQIIKVLNFLLKILVNYNPATRIKKQSESDPSQGWVKHGNNRVTQLDARR